MRVNGQFFERDDITPIGGRVKTSTVIGALKSHAHWIEQLNQAKLESNKVRSEFRTANIVEGCLCIMTGSSSCDIRQWLTRQPHRKQLKRPMRAAWSQQGRKAIRELLELTVSELEASQAFRPKVFVGPLEIPHARGTSPAQLGALYKGHVGCRQHEQKPRHATLERASL